jgi:hypothetical protein
MLFLFLISMLTVAFGVQHAEANRGVNAHPLKISANSSAGSNPMPISTSSVPPANYDEQLAVTFTQNFLNMAYNVTAVAQNDTYGYGPSYLLNGLSNLGYWYQVGLCYNWPHYEIGGYSDGFNFIYEVFNSSGISIFPIVGKPETLVRRFSGPINPDDSVLLNLYFSNENVVMYSHDWNTGASASENYSAENATFFVGNPLRSANDAGFWTGLMTEEYHPSPYYGGEQFVTYSNNIISLSSAWLWTDEYYKTSNQTQTLFYQCTSSPIAFDNYHQLHEFSANGTTEYADAYTFSTGEDPVSINLSTSQVHGDASLEIETQFFVTSSGGTSPYTYLVFLNNTLIGTYSLNSSTYNTSVDFGLQEIGSHVYYVDVVDLNGYHASSASENFTVSPDPIVSVSMPSSDSSNNLISFFTNFVSNGAIQVNASVWGGTSPYAYLWYLNGTQVGRTSVSSYEYVFAAIGTYQLSVNVTDAAGLTVESQLMTVQCSYDVIHIIELGVVIAIIAIIAATLSVFFWRRRSTHAKLTLHPRAHGTDHLLPGCEDEVTMGARDFHDLDVGQLP